MSAKLSTPLLALVVSLALGAGTLAAQDGTLTGTLADAGNGAPITSAGVEVLGADRPPTLSGPGGQFSISLPAGTYSVLVTTLGYREHREDGVRIRAGETTTLDLSLTSQALELNPVVVTASRHAEPRLEAPNTVHVIGEIEVQERPTVTPVEHLRSAPGIDIIQQGAQSSNVVLRGFNNIFSGGLHVLVDNRIAGLPSLRANLLHFLPQTNDDLERIEVVLGPGSALYGPNTANGVVHMITRSPLTSQGTTVTLGGGGKSTFQGAFRTAHKLSDNFAFKISAQQIQGDEWRFTDPTEVAARELANDDPVAFRAEREARGVASEQAALAFDRVGLRDYDRVGLRADDGFDFRRQSVDVRADWDLGGDDRVIVDYGLTNVAGFDLTGLGMGRVEDWKYQFYQARLNAGRLFTQVYLNTSDAGNSYLLQDGAPLVDESRLFVGQIQHGADVLDGRQDFTYGFDYFFTDPRTKGTINGRNEDDDDIVEVGAYIQSKTALTDQLDLIVAGRWDTHSRLDDDVFSPRAALVFEPADNHSIRASYNRAFSTPTTLNLFLDLSGGPAGDLAALGYRVRAQGPNTGINMHNPDGTLIGMRTPQAIGGSGQLLPVGTTPLWLTGIGLFEAQGAIDAGTAAFLRSLNPSDADITLNMLDARTLELAALDPTAIPDVERLKESTTTTFELGYQGLLDDRVVIAADVWYTKIEDFVSPLMVRSSLLLLDGATMVPFLVSRGLDVATATALAFGSDGPGGAIPGLAELPLAVIASDRDEPSATSLLATYVNAGDVDMVGADFAVQAFLNDHWTLASTASVVSDNYFDLGDGSAGSAEVENGIVPIALNAPKYKGTFSLAYRDARAGFNAEARLRLTSGFPAESSAGFIGTQCVPEAPRVADEKPCVEGYQLVDVTLGYQIPRTLATLQLVVSNLFDVAYQSFVGVPEIGRFIMVQAKYDLF